MIDNAEAGYGWSTYPELLEKAGISWKVYQDVGDGLDAADFWGWTGNAYIGNYGDNSLLYFHQYQNAADGSSLAQKARTGTNILKSGTLFDIFRQDVLADQLPQVSWIVAPEAYTEHGNWPANFGAWYVSQMLDALTANPEVWSKTVFFLCSTRTMGSSTTSCRQLRHSRERKASRRWAQRMSCLPGALLTRRLSTRRDHTGWAFAFR